MQFDQNLCRNQRNNCGVRQNDRIYFGAEDTKEYQEIRKEAARLRMSQPIMFAPHARSPPTGIERSRTASWHLSFGWCACLGIGPTGFEPAIS